MIRRAGLETQARFMEISSHHGQGTERRSWPKESLLSLLRHDRETLLTLTSLCGDFGKGLSRRSRRPVFRETLTLSRLHRPRRLADSGERAWLGG